MVARQGSLSEGPALTKDVKRGPEHGQLGATMTQLRKDECERGTSERFMWMGIQRYRVSPQRDQEPLVTFSAVTGGACRWTPVLTTKRW